MILRTSWARLALLAGLPYARLISLAVRMCAGASRNAGGRCCAGILAAAGAGAGPGAEPSSSDRASRCKPSLPPRPGISFAAADPAALSLAAASEAMSRGEGSAREALPLVGALPMAGAVLPALADVSSLPAWARPAQG